MTQSRSIRWSAALALLGAAACADAPVPTSSLAPAGVDEARAATGAGTTDENYRVSALLAQIDAQLAASGKNYRVVDASLRIAGLGWDGATSTILIANNRSRGTSSEWVWGDPRREGREGVTYAIGSNTSVAPITRDPNGANLRRVSAEQQVAQIEEAMSAWRDRTCSDRPITRVAVPAGTDPDAYDELVLERPIPDNYAQPADIVQAGWQPNSWFRALAGGPDGDYILGVTVSFAFTDDDDNFTDIDRNGRLDRALSEIYYNAGYAWGNTGAPNVVDFYSIITHETGHALGLGHFGKVFVTKKDGADGLQIADVKYAPYAMMNAVYVTGRNEIAGTDNSQFCQFWAGR
jgi:hypothetical protein